MLESLPLELQAYILVFLPAKTLVRTVSLTNHHFHDLVEAHVQRYCLRYLGLGNDDANDPDEAAVLDFEAQRPIDTVTAKHTLHFSHFAPVTPSLNANGPPLTSAAVFVFAKGSSSRVATDVERLKGATRSARRRANSVFVGPERTPPGGAGAYVATPFQPFLPGLHLNDQHRATQAYVSSSLDLEEHTSRRPGLSRNPSSASSRRSTSRSSSTASTSRSRARAIAHEIASAPFSFLRHSIEAANRHAMLRDPSSSLSSTTVAHATPVTTQSLEQPLDAYDWAGPPGTRAAFTALSSSSLPRRAADKPACYAFQLDPLDSFESLILTLTARRSVPDANATIAAIVCGEDASGHRLRYSKTIAEGLDRVFRDWFKPPISQPEPSTRILELDNTSCTLTIQPHPSPLAHSVHPALSASSSHDYLSRPPLSTQYATLASDERVELTFHCEHITINAARLLATLERLEHDVLANQALAKLALTRLPRIVENVSSTTRITAGTAQRVAPTPHANLGYFIISQPPSQQHPSRSAA